MFLRSKVQEMILRRRSTRSMNNSCTQQSHLPNQRASSETAPCGGGKSAAVRSPFSSPRLLHSASLPAGSCAEISTMGMPDSGTPYSMSPTSVLDASAAFVSSPVDTGSKRRPWCDGCAGTHGLADALDYTDDDQGKRSVFAAAALRAVKAQAPQLVRSCSLDRRVEFGVKNKSSWLPLCAGSEQEAAAEPGKIEPSSEDYTCVISRGPNPRTVHIFGDRVVEGGESSPRPINLPAREDRGFLSL